jgi:hypothetical protein
MSAAGASKAVASGPHKTRFNGVRVYLVPPSPMSLSEKKGEYRFRTTRTLENCILTCAHAIQLVFSPGRAPLSTLIWRIADAFKELRSLSGIESPSAQNIRWQISGNSHIKPSIKGLAPSLKDTDDPIYAINKLIKLSYVDPATGSSTPALVVLVRELCHVYGTELARIEEASGETYPMLPCLVALLTEATHLRAFEYGTASPFVAALLNLRVNLHTETIHIPILEEMDRDEYWYGYGLDDYCQPGEEPAPSGASGLSPGWAVWDLPVVASC